MQGLGKTERGEQGRDIDLTSLRSTMPASGPLQVSAPKKRYQKLWETLSHVRTETERKQRNDRREEKCDWWSWTIDAPFFLFSSGLFHLSLFFSVSSCFSIPSPLTLSCLLFSPLVYLCCLSFATELWYVLPMWDLRIRGLLCGTSLRLNVSALFWGQNTITTSIKYQLGPECKS